MNLLRSMKLFLVDGHGILHILLHYTTRKEVVALKSQMHIVQSLSDNERQ